MTYLRRPGPCLLAWVAAIFGFGFAAPAVAVEGGTGAYFIGKRDTFAGVVPPPGTYLSFTNHTVQGSVSGVSISGLPIAADVDLDFNLTLLEYTHSFESKIWGGRPALNVTVPLTNASLSFTPVTPPLAGRRLEDDAFGIGDISVTGLLGWTQGRLSHSVAFTAFAPTGPYETASIDVGELSIDVLSLGKNVWSFLPNYSATWFNPETGLEISGAASLLFSTRNEATNYQTAPAINLESAVLQHAPSGWAFGVTAYHYEQLADDSGSGADGVRDFLGASSLRARVTGAGPIVTYSGASLFGGQANFKFKYVSEFNAKRRFESDVFSLNMTLAY